MSRRSPAGGFTLIEMLVVLVLVTLIGGIMMSALSQVFDLKQRLAVFLDGSETPGLVAGWFRDTTAGLLPDGATGADRFAGERRRFDGLSTMPLSGPPGVPTHIRWELVYDTAAGRSALTYAADGRPPLTVASWAGDVGEFRYCDGVRSCGSAWPPAAGGGSPQLPALIRLEARRGDAPWTILAAPRGAREPLAPPSGLVRVDQ